MFFGAVLSLAAPSSANETLLGSCAKEYPAKSSELYLKAVDAISNNKFEIIEMQSRNGLILFRAGRYAYAITVYSIKTGQLSGIKILPVNSDFQAGLSAQNAIFASLDKIYGQK